MHHSYAIRSMKGDILFEGRFLSFQACVEAAMHQKNTLQGADFRKANLSNVMLDDVRMIDCDFTGANLTGANLSETYLERACFDGCDLYNACFAYSSLTKASFRHAHFGGTDITGSNLLNARFQGISWLNLNFTEANSIQNCYYHSEAGFIKTFSHPPVVIKGLCRPVVITDLRLIHQFQHLFDRHFFAQNKIKIQV